MDQSTASESNISSKRKRTNSNIEPLIRRSKIWFHDGNIVLEAEMTQFRVHQSVLQNYSTVFGDMFKVPQPTGETLVDACHVIKLSDTAEDWESILTVMYHGPKLYKSIEDFHFKLLVSMLRLGRKYQFDQLRDHALEHMKGDNPSKLEDWDAFFDLDAQPDSPNGKYGIEFDLVNIAEELGIHSILPVAYYNCLREQDLDAIFNGSPREDGTISQLSPPTRYILMRGRDAIYRATIDATFMWLTSDKCIPCEDCLEIDSGECPRARMENLETSLHILHDEIERGLNIWDKNVPGSQNLCEECLKVAEKVYNEGRRTIWANLPKYFGLPAWEDLKDFEI